MKTKSLIAFAVILLFLICFPIGVFIYYIETPISKNPEDWAFFGDFIGGTTNTLISLSSLIILGYLTYLVGAQSSIANKNVSLLLKRIESYDQLASYIPKLNQSVTEITRITTKMAKKLKMDGATLESIQEEKKLFNHTSYFFSDFYYFLFSFKTRFGHLFKYNFESQEHKLLIEQAAKIENYYTSTSDKFDLNELGIVALELEEFMAFSTSYGKLLHELKKELKE